MLLSAPLFTKEAKDWLTILRDLKTTDAQRTYIGMMQEACTDDLTGDEFRDRIVLALDVAKIPTGTLAAVTGIQAPYLEKYIVGSECMPRARTIACKAIASLEAASIPQYLPEEKALRSLEKIAQLDQKPRDLLFQKHLNDHSFDWSNDVIFQRILALAVDTQHYSEYTLGREMGVSAAFVASWRNAQYLPLPITRRRFLSILLMATYQPLSTD